jgi:apolipoprotein N-acyltransferase
LTVVFPLGSAFSRFFQVPLAEGAVAALVIGCVFGGGGFAIFGALAGDPWSQGTVRGIARSGLAWVAGDLFRTTALTGLPWLLLGHLLAPVPQLAQLAAVGGTALVSLWLACGNATLLAMARRESRRTATFAALALLAVGWAAGLTAPDPGIGVPGAVRLATAEPPASGALRVALVQPAAPDAWRKDPARVDDTLGRLVDLTRRAGPVDLVVWPENAIQVFLPANRERVRSALAMLDSPPRGLLLGAPRFDPDAPAPIHTSALLFDGRARRVAFHDKVHLVPFTEYVPWPVSRLGLDGPAIAPGPKPVPLPLGDVQLGPLICYELLFADLARSLVGDGAQVLVNLSNDGWFGGSGGAEQHLTAAVLRAIEFRRPLLRSTSDGITIAVDSAGRIAGRLPEREPGVLLVEVRPSPTRTLYSRVGDIVPWVALLGAGILTLGEITPAQRTRRAPARQSLR